MSLLRTIMRIIRTRNEAAMQELEIRQEARFALWALRCCAQSDQPLQDSWARVTWGFELTDVSETLSDFWRLASELCLAARPDFEWHSPDCPCVSEEELQLVQALAEASEALDATNPKPAAWWRGVVADDAVSSIDALARTWLSGLQRAGIRFPTLDLLLRGVDAPGAATSPRQ
jgi:hypothetical protein